MGWSGAREAEIATRYATGVTEDLVVLVAGCALIGLWAFLASRHRSRPTIRWATVAVACVGGLAWAWSLGWIGDDAFISFRYARNLIEGHGLVYNEGERVEGYTNFLWTMLIAGAGFVGFDLAQAAVVLSLSCFAGAIVLIAILSERLSDGAVPFSIAAFAFAANYGSASFATSGLETMFCTLLVLVALERALVGAHFASGLAGILATMGRPDHALFYVALGLAMVLGRASRRALVRYGLPFVLVFVPYFAWRWSYYGYFFPNTFYAKSGAGWHAVQGFRYLGLSTLVLGLWGAVPIAVYESIARRRELVGRYALIAIPIYIVYVAKVGGDFMLGRFVVVLLPLVFLLAELGLSRLLHADRRRVLVAASLALAFCFLPNRVILTKEKYLGVADERTFYELISFSPIEVDDKYEAWSERFNELFAGTSGPKVATGCVGIFGYRTHFYLSDIYGLLDPAVAHKPIRRRGRPGHEKRSSPAHILEHAELSDMRIYPKKYDRWTRVELPPFPLYLTRYDRELVARLNSGDEKRARPFHRIVGRVRPKKNQEQRDCQQWVLEDYYFSANNDPRNRLRLQRRFAKANGTEGLEALYFDETPDGWVSSPLETFDGDEGTLSWQYDREPEFNPVTDEARADQDFIGGHHGHYANTYAPADGDRDLLTMTSSSFEVTGDALTFRVAGGGGDQLAVELLHDGVPVRHATGCRSDILSRRIWDVRDLQGEQVQLGVRDGDETAWGHAIVDTFEQWTAPVP
ncbi:MAG: hypothetical protein AAF997_11475 [Myxococcota bacterium]